jgi:hypothetical protein
VLIFAFKNASNVQSQVKNLLFQKHGKIFSLQVDKQCKQWGWMFFKTLKTIERVNEREKNSPDWRVGLYFYSPILNSTLIWRVGEWISAPLRDKNKKFLKNTLIDCLIDCTGIVHGYDCGM